MKLSRFAVRRPIFTIMGTFIVMILGGVSLGRLPIDLMPDITYPTLSIIMIHPPGVMGSPPPLSWLGPPALATAGPPGARASRKTAVRPP